MENTITLFVYKILKFPPIMPPGAQPAVPGRSGRKVTKSLTPAFIFSAFVLPYKEDSGIEINVK
jgi:hypothetical protein